jgi:hypothetical protein
MNSRGLTRFLAWAKTRFTALALLAIAGATGMPRAASAQTSEGDPANQTTQSDQDSSSNAANQSGQATQVDGQQEFSRLVLYTGPNGGLGTPSTEPDDAEPEPPDAPPEVHLNLRTAKPTYFVGEAIPLDLAFTAETARRYAIKVGVEDRIGSLSRDQFEVEPDQGARDPLQSYLASGPFFLGGGWQSRTYLSPIPRAIHMNLNEWIEFDEPGTYRVRVASTRVSDAGEPNEREMKRLRVTSNWMELKIAAPDAAWQKETLAKSLDVLDHVPPTKDGSMDERRAAALAQLRYLGTEDSTREMARRLRGENPSEDGELIFGLVASPHRDVAMAEMNRLLADPDFPVTSEFLAAMGALDPNLAIGDQLRQAKIWPDQRSGETWPLKERLMEVLPQKRGTAAAESLGTALSAPGPGLEEIPPAILKQLIAAFPKLSLDEQANWLGPNWEQVKDPQWLPAVRDVALHYKERLPADPDFLDGQNLAAAALQDWYELDPEGARAAVIREIARPVPRIDGNQLAFLSEDTLPEVEEIIAKNFLSAKNDANEASLAQLLLRYADEDVESLVLDRVTAKVEGGRWACVPQEKMLAYLLRVDPQEAAALIAEAMEPREGEELGCRRSLLMDIASDYNDPAMEPTALEALHDANEAVVGNAAQYLGSYGLADAEKPLWDRYLEWSAEWKGRVKEVEAGGDGEQANDAAVQLGQSLAQAILGGPGWLSDPAKLKRGRQLAVMPEVGVLFSQALINWSNEPLKIVCSATMTTEGCEGYSVVQYDFGSADALKAKIEQFPRGTQFLWTVEGSATQAGSDSAFSDVAEFAAKRGIAVKRAAEPAATVN